MAKLYFTYATMGSGKSSSLLQTEWNYRERSKSCLLLTATVDDRFGTGRITSRLGLSAEAETFSPGDDLLEKFFTPAAARGISCVLVDEVQFATPDQIWQLARGVDTHQIPCMAYGLRSTFRGTSFPGSDVLLTIADELREMRTICNDPDCGSAARMVIRLDADGAPTLSGEMVQIGGNESYVPVCRKHWLAAHGKL